MSPERLIAAATGMRHGLLRPPIDVPVSAADPRQVHHSSVARDDRPATSAGGGVARTRLDARVAAVGEALERYAATHATLPLARAADLAGARILPRGEWSLHDAEQQARPDYPALHHTPVGEWLTECYDLASGEPVWVPAALVSMSPDYDAIATSSGLAADPDPYKALLRALQELIERDAYMVTWLHQLGGRLVDSRPVDARLGGELRVYDLTPAWSPHPVALVTGTLDLNGSPRHSVGVACRSRWAAAVERAELEMLQGVMFVGHRLTVEPELAALTPEGVTGFDEHAVYYSANPDRWPELPIHRGARWADPPGDGVVGDPTTELRELVASLRSEPLRLCYRDLSTVDVNQLGITVVRVLSPDLTPIHHHHGWPFLGGRTSDVHWRYPDAAERRVDTTFPSPHPHALG